MSTPKFTFLKDQPLDQDGQNFFNFYHSIIAPALCKILESDSTPHTIGLFGSWGTGKSTIIKMLEKDRKLKAPIFIFDAWKYQHDALRRTFLIELVKFLDKEGVKVDGNILKPLFTSTSTSITTEVLQAQASSKRTRVLAWLRAKALPIILGLSFCLWIASYLIYRKNDAVITLRQMAGTIWAVSGAALVFKPLIEGLVKQALDRFFTSLKQQSEQRTQTDYQERFNSPEQFEEIFQDIIGKIDKKIVIVFDNIDRVQGDVAISMLATIKTFMEPKKGNLIFIIPCDAEAIEKQIAEYYKPRSTDDTNPDDFTPADYLRKVFNLVIWVPEFVGSDLEEYTKRCLAATGEISNLLSNEDVILVINSAFSRNPREIIQFVNNLTALVVTAQETEVKDIINTDVAYLAKVLVLRQKFPRAYGKLKENWYSPESIINDFANMEPGLNDFMNLTNRITVRDAEPFIYFKNPDSSRGIKHPDDLKAALVKTNGELALEASKNEDKDAVVEFVIDFLLKHKGQESLQNIFISQFELLDRLGVVPTQKRYYDNLAQLLDTQLWQHYRELPVERIFNLLSSPNLTKKLRSVIIERYILVLGTSDQASLQKDMDIQILENFRRRFDLLNAKQSTDVRATIEKKFASDEAVLSLFNGDDEQSRFVTKSTIDRYITTIEASNIVQRVGTLERYKDFMLRQGQFQPLLAKVAERLRNENAINRDYSEDKAQVFKALGSLVETFKVSLKEQESTVDELNAEISKAFTGAANWENQALVTIELWRIIFNVSKEQQKQSMTHIRDFFASRPERGVIQVLDYWDEHRGQNLLWNVIDSLFPRLLSEEHLLLFTYELADEKTKSKILLHLIEDSPLDKPYDINFIKQQTTTPDRTEVLKQLLIRVGKFTYHQKAPYYEYLADKIRKNDPAEIKDLAIGQIKSLLMNDDPNISAVGFEFLTKAKFPSITTKRELAKEILTWLREPGKIIDYRHLSAVKTISLIFNDLQQPPQIEFVYTLFNLISQNSEQQTIDMAAEALKAMRPSYSIYSKDYEDILDRIQDWPEGSTKDTTLEALSYLRPQRLSGKEKKYWDVLSKLNSQ